MVGCHDNRSMSDRSHCFQSEEAGKVDVDVSLKSQPIGTQGGSSPVKPLETPSPRCVSMVILNPVRFTVKKNSQNALPWNLTKGMAFVFPNVEET